MENYRVEGRRSEDRDGTEPCTKPSETPSTTGGVLLAVEGDAQRYRRSIRRTRGCANCGGSRSKPGLANPLGPARAALLRAAGPFAELAAARFTKRLVFSSWHVVPKAVATLLSYEAERRMVTSFDPAARNTPEARKALRPLLNFSRHASGRPAGNG